MKKTFFLLLAVSALLATACKTKTSPAVLKTDVPARPAGQENVIGLRTEPLETVRIGVVGLGMRGGDAVERLTYVPGAVVTALAGFPSVDYCAWTIMHHLEDYGGQRFEVGYASAISTILFLIMIGANLLVNKLLAKIGQ